MTAEDRPEIRQLPPAPDWAPWPNVEAMRPCTCGMSNEAGGLRVASAVRYELNTYVVSQWRAVTCLACGRVGPWMGNDATAIAAWNAEDAS